LCLGPSTKKIRFPILVGAICVASGKKDAVIARSASRDEAIPC
jgi:hypothetical protein